MLSIWDTIENSNSLLEKNQILFYIESWIYGIEKKKIEDKDSCNYIGIRWNLYFLRAENIILDLNQDMVGPILDVLK